MVIPLQRVEEDEVLKRLLIRAQLKQEIADQYPDFWRLGSQLIDSQSLSVSERTCRAIDEMFPAFGGNNHGEILIYEVCGLMAMWGKVKILPYLLQHWKVDVNKNHGVESPLLMALHGHSEEAALCLIKGAGADINVQFAGHTSIFGLRPIMACYVSSNVSFWKSM